MSTVLLRCPRCGSEWEAAWLPATRTDPGCVRDHEDCPRCGATGEIDGAPTRERDDEDDGFEAEMRLLERDLKDMAR